jgi:Ras-related protein Rab-28
MASKINDSDDEDVQNYQYKVILLGDGAVGKTSIATRFADNAFSQNYKQTVGVDFFIKRISLRSTASIALQLWDIGGQSIGSKMITHYISGADAVLLCYDITNYESFANLEDWYRLVLKAFKDKDVLPFVALLGNKNDLRHLTAVRFAQHTKFAEENEMPSFLMSAKNGDHVSQAFWKVASTLSSIPYSQFEREMNQSSSVISAVIVEHQRHDESVNEGKVPDYTGKSKSAMSNCSIS